MKKIKTHQHHIVPRHMGGTDDKSNLITVTVEQHANLHRILYEVHGHWQDYCAWKGLSGRIDKEEIFREIARHANQGNKHFAGKTHSPETKKKISEWMKANKNWIGHDMPHTEETKNKISEKLKGNNNKKGKTGKQKNKFIGEKDWLKGKNNPATRPEVREKLRQAALKREAKRREERLENNK